MGLQIQVKILLQRNDAMLLVCVKYGSQNVEQMKGKSKGHNVSRNFIVRRYLRRLNKQSKMLPETEQAEQSQSQHHLSL